MKEANIRIFNDSLLIVLALVSVGLLGFELTASPTGETLAMIRLIDLTVALIFGAEFLIRLLESDKRKDFMKQNWWQILASIPVTASGTQALRSLMLIRLFRLVRMTSMLARVSLFTKSLARVLKETHMALIVTLLAAVLLGGSLAFYMLEQAVNPTVTTFYDSFWFISEVMTNTGVGEVYPMTPGGRAVGILSMFAGAIIFGRFIALSRIPFELASWAGSLNLPPFAVIVIILLVYLVLGCFIDALALILLTIPIFYPVAVNVLGYDPIWFGVIIVMVVAMGVITPPVGMNVYIVKGIARDVPLEEIFKGIWPFLAAIIICLALLITFPQLATFLPSLMR